MDVRAGASYQPTPSREGNVDLDTPGAIVPRRHVHGRAGRCAHGPFALAAIGRELRIGKECLQRRLARAPLQLSALDARPARYELRALRQQDLVDDSARDLALERALGDVR